MSYHALRVLGISCFVVLAGCSSKGKMAHVKVETTDYAVKQGLTVRDWSWSNDRDILGDILNCFCRWGLATQHSRSPSIVIRTPRVPGRGQYLVVGELSSGARSSAVH